MLSDSNSLPSQWLCSRKKLTDSSWTCPVTMPPLRIFWPVEMARNPTQEVAALAVSDHLGERGRMITHQHTARTIQNQPDSPGVRICLSGCVMPSPEWNSYYRLQIQYDCLLRNYNLQMHASNPFGQYHLVSVANIAGHWGRYQNSTPGRGNNTSSAFVDFSQVWTYLWERIT